MSQPEWTPQGFMCEKPYRVLIKRGVFVDEARGGREVPYKIYYPVEHGLERMPVILWSHGFGGNRDGASFISRFIAGQGYTVVHLTHKGSDSSLWEEKGGHPWDILKDIDITPEMILTRVGDVAFVLDRLGEVEAEIARYMDMSCIGMSGHSLGALTAQAVAGMRVPDGAGGLVDVCDERISCGIAYSPVPVGEMSDAQPEELYGGIRIPMLFMTGTEDHSPKTEAIDYQSRLVVHDYAGDCEKYLQVLEGGDHMIYNGTRGKLPRNPVREEHEVLVLDAVFAFWQAYLKGDVGAKRWLKAQYG